jgi:DNA polymerase
VLFINVPNTGRKMSQGICKWYWLCPLKFYYEQGKLDKKWIDKYCMGNWESCARYQMEERGEPHPDYMLPNGEIREELA